MSDRLASLRCDVSASSEGALNVMLLRSQHVGWRGLRTLLELTEGVRVVADVMLQGPGIGEATRLQPDVLLMAGDDHAAPTVQLVQAVRDTTPNSAVVVLGTGQDRSTLIDLARAGAAGYLAWGELDEKKLRGALHAAKTGLRIATDGIVCALTAPRESFSSHLRRQLILTDDECAILHRLASGERESEIAVAECLSLRTVERRIAKLERRLGFERLSELRLRARDLGFGRTDSEATAWKLGIGTQHG